MMLCAKVRHSN